mmetsp:Transcript_10418/g.16692  ORF Transcript_10418/g.16692 Transcript_10418/m.16692 type:complete len:164 (+) Transcript_10418:2519-3010(+)
MPNWIASILVAADHIPLKRNRCGHGWQCRRVKERQSHKPTQLHQKENLKFRIYTLRLGKQKGLLMNYLEVDTEKTRMFQTLCRLRKKVILRQRDPLDPQRQPTPYLEHQMNNDFHYDEQSNSFGALEQNSMICFPNVRSNWVLFNFRNNFGFSLSFTTMYITM